MTIHRTPVEMHSGRMQPIARVPIFLALDGKRAMLAGGNAVAAWKAELFSAAGARVDVFAEDISEELRAIANDPPRGAVVLHERRWTKEDLNGAAVAVGAFAEEAEATVFAQAARDAGVPVNVIDKPAFCDFAFGAIVNRSPLVIGISTDGAAPVFAQAIRARLETLLPNGFAAWAAAAQSWRSAVKNAGLSFAARCAFWQLFSRHALMHAQSEPTQADFERLIAGVRGQGEAAEGGWVMLVDAGLGDPELLTLRDVRALQSADVILFDDLVSREVLDFARREARKLLIGKAAVGPARGDDDVEALAVGLAERGKRVVRLKGCDPSRRMQRADADATKSLGAIGGAKSSAARSGAAA